MQPVIRRIRKTDLAGLEPLLRASYGESLELQDELDYFDTMPHASWFFLSEGDESRGFIRCFGIEENLFLAELYVTPSAAAEVDKRALLGHFRAHHVLGKRAVLRFDVLERDETTLRLLAELFPEREVKRFLHLERRLERGLEAGERQETRFSDSAFFEKVAGVFRDLKAYDSAYLQTLYDENALHIHCADGEPVAALVIAPREAETCEIIMLATDPARLREGHSAALLRSFFAAQRFSRIALKVNEKNKAALNLYRKVGFEAVPAKGEQWWYAVLPSNET